MKGHLCEILYTRTKVMCMLPNVCAYICASVSVHACVSSRVTHQFYIFFYHGPYAGNLVQQLLTSGASWERKSKLSFMKYITVTVWFTRVTRRLYREWEIHGQYFLDFTIKGLFMRIIVVYIYKG